MNTMKTFLSNVLDESFKSINGITLKQNLSDSYSCDLNPEHLKDFLRIAFERTQVIVESDSQSSAIQAWTKGFTGHTNAKTAIILNREGDTTPFRMTYSCKFKRRLDSRAEDPLNNRGILLTIGVGIEKSFIQPLIAQFILDFQFELLQTNEGTWIIGNYDGALRQAEFLRSMSLYNTRMLTQVITDFISEVLTNDVFKAKVTDYYNE